MKLKKMGLAALLAGATVVSTMAYAAYVQYWTLTEYYSDATYTTYVGARLRDCNGHTSTSGTVTIYKRVAEQYPCGQPLP